MVHKAHDPPSNFFGWKAAFGAKEEDCKAADIDCSTEILTAVLEFVAYTEEN
jgi:hypothetical protein